MQNFKHILATGSIAVRLRLAKIVTELDGFGFLFIKHGHFKTYKMKKYRNLVMLEWFSIMDPPMLRLFSCDKYKRDAYSFKMDGVVARWNGSQQDNENR